jgi:hypothetical protein
MSAKSIYKKRIKRDIMSETFATKEDLHRVELKLEGKISEVKYDLIKWMITLLIGQTALLLGIFLRK